MLDYQLTNFEVMDSGKNLVVLISGSRNYYSVLRSAFTQYRFSVAWNDKNNRFDWGTYIYEIDRDGKDKVIKLLKLFSDSVFIEDNLSQTFALSYHSYIGFDSSGRTEIGDLVYGAKPYSKPPNKRNLVKAKVLAEHFIGFIRSHPSYMRSDYLVAVPPNPGKSFDLPSFLVKEICGALPIKDGCEFISKIRITKMKDQRTLKAKTEEIQGAFVVKNRTIFTGKLVTIIDDVYESGVTLDEVATTLQSSGAAVQGLVATKTLRSVE